MKNSKIEEIGVTNCTLRLNSAPSVVDHIFNSEPATKDFDGLKRLQCPGHGNKNVFTYYLYAHCCLVDLCSSEKKLTCNKRVNAEERVVLAFDFFEDI